MAYAGLNFIFSPLLRRKIRHLDGETHLPTHPPFIVAANHLGYMDAFLIARLVIDKLGGDIYFPTTQKMWEHWGSFLARRWLHMIPIYDREKGVSLDEAVSRLKDGNVIGIFPEGKRNTHPGNLMKGKTGAVRLALLTGAPLIPLGLVHNTGFSLGQALRSLLDDDKGVDIKIGPAISLAEFANRPFSKELLEASTRKLMIAIGQLCGKTYSF